MEDSERPPSGTPPAVATEEGVHRIRSCWSVADDRRGDPRSVLLDLAQRRPEPHINAVQWLEGIAQEALKGGVVDRVLQGVSKRLVFRGRALPSNRPPRP